MNDSLENFINQNKAAFDDKEPSEKVWKGIHQKLFSSPGLWNSLPMWRAAAAILFGVCAYLLVPKFAETKEKHLALNEFKDIESFYITQISEKVDLLKEYEENETGLNGYTNDFQQLEAMYQVLKEEMRTRPSQKVKDALVLNLLIRIDLLNKQLHKIEQQESSTPEDKEVTT
jgi:predicted nuclease with TOPRIM domain